MNTLLIQILFVLWSTGTIISSDSTAIKVMTYNIRLDFEGDGEDNWQHRKADMVDYIQTHDPDFVGIQEALYHQVSFLDDSLEQYNYIGVGRDDGRTGGEFMAILYKADKWTIEREGTFWLSASPGIPSMGWDAACFRVCTYGIFKHKNGSSIALFNTHFDHVGKMARKESVQVLQSHIATVIDKYPTILMGDFNITPTDSVYTALGAFLTDSRSLASAIQEASVGTFNGFKRVEPFERRIDYIFVKNEGLAVQKYLVEKPFTKLGRQLSDHFPVIVELEVE